MKRKLFYQNLRTALLAAMCLISFSFVSCSGDDDDEETTSSATKYVNGYAAVDLGLSVKWATCNIGADSPEDYGNYYAWGETETKDSYTTSNYSIYKIEMDDIAGDVEYDAATANWGSSWRMPTEEEFEELLEKCSWTWTKQNGVKGYLVCGSNNNSIFLPCTGWFNKTSLEDLDDYGSYWSSTPRESNVSGAFALDFGSDYYDVDKLNRQIGLTVRPVTD